MGMRGGASEKFLKPMTLNQLLEFPYLDKCTAKHALDQCIRILLPARILLDLMQHRVMCWVCIEKSLLFTPKSLRLSVLNSLDPGRFQAAMSVDVFERVKHTNCD